MGDRLVSFIPQLIAQKGWSEREFTKRCIMADLSTDTAYRLMRGETNLSTSTLLTLAIQVFQVDSICKLVDLGAPETDQ